MMLFDDLRDNEWALVEGLFCSEPARSERRGRPRVEARSVVNAVLWVLSTGEGWSKLPGRYPSPPTCRRRFDEWQADGTLAEIVKRLGTSGRQISLRGRIGASAAKPPAPPSRDRLRGASGPIRNPGARPSRWRNECSIGRLRPPGFFPQLDLFATPAVPSITVVVARYIYLPIFTASLHSRAYLSDISTSRVA
ncbi:transposase [Burkholderia cepacia]|uniref:transposase n=1 Tax=Burkholderia cepacia TaxID=292 RepID=UPI0010683A90|nr:transposase [Burkholderia cepacia]TES66976.1 transposase [Burkholderia cepacia]